MSAQESRDSVSDPRQLRDYDWQPRYSTGRDDLYSEFYEPAISRARTYDRAVGFFRSTVFNLTGSAVAHFALRGGQIRLVCSLDMSEEDAEAIDAAIDLRPFVEGPLAREIDKVLKEPSVRPAVEVLGALVASGHMDVRVCVWPPASGLFHDKVGILHDSHGNSLSFVGSANETWRAWHTMGNHESFEVFRSWTEEGVRVEAHGSYFESLWSGQEPGLRVVEIPTAIRERLVGVNDESPQDVLRRHAGEHPSQPRRPFPFQREAVACWEKRGCRGILQHATGTGKTVTALLAVRGWLEAGRPVLILVPSRLLLRQWEKEIRIELTDLDPAVLLVGGSNDQWRKKSLLRTFTEPSGEPRITVATIQTACTRDFLRRLNDGEHLLVVTDEVHRVGAPEARKALGVSAGGRLGLSATPDRYGDPEGNAAIRDFFGETLEPVIDLRRAIALRRLCTYRYFPHLVSLDDEEIAEWKLFTARIVAVYSVVEKHPEDIAARDRLKHLLIQRARIAKQAAEKTAKACEIVLEGYKARQHWLVYCDDRHQLADVRDGLRDRGLPVLEYHSAMDSDAEATMDRFDRDGGVLVAIKCLDEGVDIPLVSHAAILASSRNPREFIQRRGRVLRIAPGKRHATIHDLLVRPPDDADGSSFDALTEREIARAVIFARDAENQSALMGLMQLCAEWGVDIDGLAVEGVEAEDGEEEEE